MKKQIAKTLKHSLLDCFKSYAYLLKPAQNLFRASLTFPNIKKRDIWLTLVPGLLWLAATNSRPFMIPPVCNQAPQTCQKASVLSIDQTSLGIENGPADEYSYFTQNLSGILAITVPVGWSVSKLLFQAVSPAAWFLSAGTDLIIVFQSIFWNGFFTEISHLLFHRPRPFVYANPSLLGLDPAHYVSFYSGHTSFSATTNTITLLILLARGAPLLLILIYFGIGESLILSTAYFRILAGRHFLTDTLCGALAGSLIALWVFSRHQKR